MNSWPKHKPETSLHHIVLDGVRRDFTEEQIIAETNGIATPDMIKFYRDAFNNEQPRRPGALVPYGCVHELWVGGELIAVSGVLSWPPTSINVVFAADYTEPYPGVVREVLLYNEPEDNSVATVRHLTEDDVRRVGGVVQCDGYVVFTNLATLNELFIAHYRQPPAADSAGREDYNDRR